MTEGSNNSVPYTNPTGEPFQYRVTYGPGPYGPTFPLGPSPFTLFTGPQTVNKLVACEPFQNLSVKTKNLGGFAVAEQKTELTRLQVMFQTNSPDMYLNAGQHVYLRGEAYRMPWASQVFEVNGVKFILVPFDQIVMVE